MKPVLASAALCLALFASTPQAAFAENPAESRQKIEAVIKAFDKAITDKDKEGFMRLFLRENITWASVSTDRTLATYRAKLKDPAQPIPKVMSATPRMFIERIAGDPEPGTETFENVRIDTDGDIAQVWFDYSFMKGDHRSNWGKEAWHMVRTESGWKIASVIYSTESNPEPPPKK
ncbi:nuclear transport factor 2 family protein [Massilia alkalitolerans]|uniref:nuclear transport factor 2 family protein n=1 Tax=Massilia alkalitolerans TaxID=286638 RepID=UPI0028A8CD1E|nr:nuclear transport factor 2 family protein [Massilia alkalitolerans]